MSRYDLIIFDFDGTLADTGPAICACFAEAVAGTAAERSAETFRPWLGHPLVRVHEMLRTEVPTFGQGLRKFTRRYKRAYARLAPTAINVFPGVRDYLPTQRLPMAIASTKPSDTLRAQALLLGIAGHFDHIQGTDGFPHKPDPAILYRVWDVLPAAPERTVFVGDSTMDIEAGKAAGVTTIGVTHGAHDRQRLSHAGADHIIDHLSQLHDLGL